MLMHEKFKKPIYVQLQNFVEFIDTKNVNALQTNFGISMLIFEEIEETLGEYFPVSVSLGIAPFEIAFSEIAGTTTPIDLYTMNDPEKWGLECVLWANNKRSEPILHAEIEIFGDIIKFQYKYIGS